MSAIEGPPAAAAAVLGLALMLVAFAGPAGAQALYKYRDANGVWVFTDRRPAPDVAFEELERETPERPAGVLVLEHVRDDGTLMLVARNPYHSTVQLAFALTATQNLAPRVPTSGNRLLEPRSETELIALERESVRAPLRVEYRFQYIYGHPGAKHEPDAPYRLPYALASSHEVSQAYPEQVTHADPSSRHAVDFVMPVGTGVYAARGGMVIEVASDFYESGTDLAADGPRANIVRVLHDDGTMALYAHLNWNSIRVIAGQRVARGEHIADSGNTGFSTGPHLHFVVQRNAGGSIESVPVEFAGPGGRAFSVAAGDRPTAY